jgi:sterol desaturase/sphingolipid hydroxylase (fatty acid hydroxylase superfamily)
MWIPLTLAIIEGVSGGLWFTIRLVLAVVKMASLDLLPA